MQASTPALACSSLLAAILCIPPAAGAGPQVRRMFVTSTVGTGDLGSWPDAGAATGVAAGDAICQAHAAAAGLPNGGTYAAWLSDGTTDAYCHLLGVTGTRAGNCGAALSAGPWLRTDGRIFSGDLAELTAAGPIRPALLDEDGDVLFQFVQTWTGTLADGTLDAGNACDDWTNGLDAPGRIGRGSRTVRNWTEQGIRNGVSTQYLLCFETGEGVPLAEPVVEAGLVFSSSAVGTGDLGSWPQAGAATGLAAGDAICRTVATNAGLPDPEGFVAWLSDSTADAIDRLGGFPGPWQRLDGALAVSLGPGGPEIETPLNLSERRQNVGFWVWTGTDDTGGASGDDCDGWTDGAAQGLWGWTHDVYLWTAGGPDVCSSLLRIYCFGTTMVLFMDDFESGILDRWTSVQP